MTFWGREGACENVCNYFFLENDWYGEQKPKMKNTKDMTSSSHKWVLGEILQKLKGCLGKKIASVMFMCICVCYGLHLPQKEGNVKILHLPPKKKHPSTAPSHLAS